MGKNGARREPGAGHGRGRSRATSAERAKNDANAEDGRGASGERPWGDMPTMTATAITAQHDWVKTVLFDRGYLARIRGDAIKVYLAIIEASGGLPDCSLTISLNRLMQRTKLSCPTVIESLGRLEELGLVVSTTHERGKVKTYYICDPPPAPSESIP
jgi:hypothetical protein